MPQSPESYLHRKNTPTREITTSTIDDEIRFADDGLVANVDGADEMTEADIDDVEEETLLGEVVTVTVEATGEVVLFQSDMI